VLRSILLERQPSGGPTESALEDLALRVLRRHGLPHSDSVRYRADRAKWNLLTRLGWALVILTEFDLRERPRLAALDVASVVRRLAGSLRVA